jgi:hypothetical protein
MKEVRFIITDVANKDEIFNIVEAAVVVAVV